MLYSHFNQNCIFSTFWKLKILVLWRKIVKNLLMFVCLYCPKNWFHKNLHNSGMVGSRKLPDPLLNHILSALSICVQYTLSFQLTNFGLKCLFKELIWCTKCPHVHIFILFVGAWVLFEGDLSLRVSLDEKCHSFFLTL